MTTASDTALEKKIEEAEKEIETAKGKIAEVEAALGLDLSWSGPNPYAGRGEDFLKKRLSELTTALTELRREKNLLLEKGRPRSETTSSGCSSQQELDLASSILGSGGLKVYNGAECQFQVVVSNKKIDKTQEAKSGAGANASAPAGFLASLGLTYETTKSTQSEFREYEASQLIKPGHKHKFDTNREEFFLIGSFTKDGKVYGFKRRCRGWKISRFYISEKHTATDDLLNLARAEDVAEYETTPPDLDRRFAQQEQKLEQLTDALTAAVSRLSELPEQHRAREPACGCFR
eukprot:CAMPEP_0118893328 /NCGR_PEP_ID=MMETSP1166-20130328/2582_1 /TAXON_ID=1104430 /ORGANISM="Chrysoreinhardia sp, Strain CCMP3193" /LENGTH=290 /DNA_ID=CAMNT_0006832131 /DNA_START=122 /DNA_END=994 /DNA_ORIENTATION=+